MADDPDQLFRLIGIEGSGVFKLERSRLEALGDLQNRASSLFELVRRIARRALKGEHRKVIRQLIEILAKATVDELLRQEAGETQTG
jgi:hypothetical protein